MKELSMRASKCLRSRRIPENPDLVKYSIENDGWHPRILPGCGPKLQAEIFSWCQANRTEPEHESGLSIRALNVLYNANISVDQDEIKEAILTGVLDPKKSKLRNYGKGTHRELCEFAGVMVTASPNMRIQKWWVFHPITGERLK